MSSSYQQAWSADSASSGERRPLAASASSSSSSPAGSVAEDQTPDLPRSHALRIATIVGLAVVAALIVCLFAQANSTTTAVEGQSSTSAQRWNGALGVACCWHTPVARCETRNCENASAAGSRVMPRCVAHDATSLRVHLQSHLAERQHSVNSTTESRADHVAGVRTLREMQLFTDAIRYHVRAASSVTQPAFTVDLSSHSSHSSSSHSSSHGSAKHADEKKAEKSKKVKAKSSSSSEKSNGKKDSKSSSSRHGRPSGPVNTLPTDAHTSGQGGAGSSSSSSSGDSNGAKKDNSIINSSKDCQGPFPGYPYCQDKVDELRGNWMINPEQEAYYRSKGVDGTQCSFLTYLNLNGFYCQW